MDWHTAVPDSIATNMWRKDKYDMTYYVFLSAAKPRPWISRHCCCCCCSWGDYFGFWFFTRYWNLYGITFEDNNEVTNHANFQPIVTTQPEFSANICRRDCRLQTVGFLAIFGPNSTNYGHILNNRFWAGTCGTRLGCPKRFSGRLPSSSKIFLSLFTTTVYGPAVLVPNWGTQNGSLEGLSSFTTTVFWASTWSTCLAKSSHGTSRSQEDFSFM